MKKAWMVVLFLTLLLGHPAGMAQQLVHYASFADGSRFYIDLDSFEPAEDSQELFYYVYGFSKSRNTVSLNAIHCGNGTHRSQIKSWLVNPDGEYTSEQRFYVTPFYLRPATYLYGVLQAACKVNSALAGNW
jgi:hypothetical protein